MTDVLLGVGLFLAVVGWTVVFSVIGVWVGVGDSPRQQWPTWRRVFRSWWSTR